MNPLAPLRADLELVPIQHEGKPLYVVRDPEAEGDEAMALSPGAIGLIAFFDGKRTAAEAGELFRKQTGAGVSDADVATLAESLEKAGLLDSEAGRASRRAREEAFKAAATRPAQFSGPAGYPPDDVGLAMHLGGFFRHAKGPGRAAAETPTKAAARLLVAPHIDLHRGGPAYAWAYGALADGPPPDLIVALGVAHRSPDSPWVFTKKAYETPFGPMKVDEAAYASLTKDLWYDPRADEAVHRREHSLEFQAAWLRYLWRDACPPWVPILCSTFERFSEGEPPTGVETVEGALKAIGARLAELSKKKRLLILAGIDLAHVGPRFGDDVELTPELRKKIETEDAVSLDKALALDADGFYRSVTKDGHWRHVCGLSALYTALRWTKAAAPDAKGERLTYGQADDPAGGVVSFASLIYR